MRDTSHYHWRYKTDPATEWLPSSILYTISAQSLCCSVSLLLGLASLLMADRFALGTSTSALLVSHPSFWVQNSTSPAKYKSPLRLYVASALAYAAPMWPLRCLFWISLFFLCDVFVNVEISNRNYPYPSLQEITSIFSLATVVLPSLRNLIS